MRVQSRTQSMPVRRLGAGHAQHLTCERAYSGTHLFAIDEPGRNRNLKININAQQKIRKRAITKIKFNF